MEVSIKLSLQGGHVWETTCDEDDPMVFGLVSALPGATLDRNLPQDGLIQVEKRSGERLFLSRSSLVSVSVQRVPSGSRTIAALEFAGSAPNHMSLTTPAPFALHAPFLGDEGAASVVALATAAANDGSAEGGAWEIHLEDLPPSIGMSFVATMTASMQVLPVLHDAEAGLDLRFFVVDSFVSEFRMQAPGGAQAILVAFWPLGRNRTPLATLELGDRLTGNGASSGNGGRILTLVPDQAVVVAGTAGAEVIKLDWNGEEGRVLIAEAFLISGKPADEA